MNDDDDTIRDLLAWAKDKPMAVKSMAKVLAQQLRLQHEVPENKALREVIGETIKLLKAKIDAAH